MNKYFMFIVSGAFCCLSSLHVYSQGSSTETANISYPVSLFMEANASQSRLNNGREHILPAPNIIEHPFFETKVWTAGKVVYDGVAFENIDMLYDISKDEVVILNYALPNKLSLVKQKVREFTLLDHKFIYLKYDTLRQISVEGFYDQLYHQKLSVLAKRKKVVKVNTDATQKEKFVIEDRYYLVKEGILHPVKSKASVLKLLPDKKTDLQQYLRKNGIIFRSDPERAIVLLASYYDQLVQ